MFADNGDLAISDKSCWSGEGQGSAEDKDGDVVGGSRGCLWRIGVRGLSSRSER